MPNNTIMRWSGSPLSAVELAPDDAERWENRGNVLIDLKRPADAVLSFQRTLKLNPRHWDAAYRCGFLLQELGRPAEAIVYFDLVDRLQPNQAVILEMRAAVLHRLKRFDEALADNQRAYALNPGNAATCNNIGAALQVLGRDEEALPWFDRAAALRPDFIDALTNKAASLQQLHRFEEAAATYRQAKAIDPGDAETDWNLSLLQLLTGNFREGWAGREARWNARRAETSLTFPGPKWRGEQDVAGKTILIYMDEGLGDAIQFARYVPEVAARGAQVILLVLPAVYPLLAKLPGVAQCIAILGNGNATGIRPALSDVQPAAGLRDAARYDSVAAIVFTASARSPRAGLGRASRSARQIAGRPGLGRQPRAQERSQPIDLAAHAVAHPRHRRDFRQSAEGPEARGSGNAAGISRRHRPHRRPH